MNLLRRVFMRMKLKLIIAALFVALATIGFDCINDPLIVSVNLDPIEACWNVNTGPGNFNQTAGPFEIKSFIPSGYEDDVTGLRIYDITVHVHGPHPNGVVSGDGYFRLDGGTEYHLLSFSGQYSSFETDVSVLNPGGLLTIDPAGMTALVTAISDPAHLPNQIVVRGSGTGPAVTQTFQVCCVLKFQASAKAN